MEEANGQQYIATKPQRLSNVFVLQIIWKQQLCTGYKIAGNAGENKGEKIPAQVHYYQQHGKKATHFNVVFVPLLGKHGQCCDY